MNLTTALNFIPGHAISDGRQVPCSLGGKHEVLRHLVGLPVEGVGQRDGAGLAVSAVRGGGGVAQRRDGHVVEEVVVEVGGGGLAKGVLVLLYVIVVY